MPQVNVDNMQMPDEGGDNNWREWRHFVLAELRRHNKALEDHFDDDARKFALIATRLDSINSKIAYATGALAVIVFVINVGLHFINKAEADKEKVSVTKDK